jgi:hypothetical protein
MKPRDINMTILTVGLMLTMVLLVVFDFVGGLETNRPTHNGIIELIKLTVTGVLGIVAGYFAGKNSKDD